MSDYSPSDPANENLDPGQMICQVLDVVGYDGDKNEFSEKFIVDCKMQALVDLTGILTFEERDTVKNLLSEGKYEEVKKILEKYFPEEKRMEVVSNAAKKHFHAFLDALLPTLSGEKVRKLDSCLKTFRFATSGV